MYRGIFLVALTATFSSCGPASPNAERIVPEERSGFAFAYDAARNNVLLFGGSDSSSTRLGDTWTWTIDGWEKHDVAGPGARSDAQVAYDAARQETVLFSGLAMGGRSPETWTWDGSTWTLADTLGPPARQLGAMAYDAAREQIVLFGGSGAGRTILGDTWLWNGSNWTEVEPSVSPSARGSHLMIFDDASTNVVLVGGYDSTTQDDTWDWDGQDWSLRDTTSTPPRLHGSMAYDGANEKLMIFGGFSDTQRENDLWIWEDGGWKEIERPGPTVRAEHDGVYVPDVGYVMFGGVTGLEMSVSERQKDNDLWILSNSEWSRW